MILIRKNGNLTKNNYGENNAALVSIKVEDRDRNKRKKKKKNSEMDATQDEIMERK